MSAETDDRPIHTVLVVDDDAWICHFLSRYLKRNGYQVLTAQNGKQALELASVLHPQVILLDIVMPEMDGIETLRQLRKSGENSVVIVITGHVRRQAEEDAMLLGVFDYLAKPFELRTLKESLTEGLIYWKQNQGASA